MFQTLMRKCIFEVVEVPPSTEEYLGSLDMPVRKVLKSEQVHTLQNINEGELGSSEVRFVRPVPSLITATHPRQKVASCRVSDSADAIPHTVHLKKKRSEHWWNVRFDGLLLVSTRQSET